MASSDEALIDRIYEAGVVADLWPSVLGELAQDANGLFATLFTIRDGQQLSTWSPAGTRVVESYFAEGWPARTDRPQRLIARNHPGFLTDLDVYTREEIETEPVYVDFLRRIGTGWAAATAIRVPGQEPIVISIERPHAVGPYGAAEVARLDALRPHLARAALLSSRLGLERARAATEALALVGLPGALVDRAGEVVAANALFTRLWTRLGQAAPSRSTLAKHLARLATRPDVAEGASLPLRGREDDERFILHLIPIQGSARDIFSGSAFVVVLTSVAVTAAPSASLLQALFDLSPAEARVARAVAEGETLEGLAAQLDLSRETLRSQLKAVLAKTGTGRQAELAALLAGSGLPVSAG